jgi:hypothetical protein
MKAAGWMLVAGLGPAGAAMAGEPVTLQAWGKLPAEGGEVEVPVAVGQHASIWLQCKGCAARVEVSGVPGRLSPSTALGESEAGVEYSIYASGNLRVTVSPTTKELRGPYALWVRLDGTQALGEAEGRAPGWARKAKLPDPEPWAAANVGEDGQPVVDAPPFITQVAENWACAGIAGAAAFVAGQNPKGLEALRAMPGDPDAWMLADQVFVPSCQAARKADELNVLCSSDPDLSKIDGQALYRMLALQLDECLETWEQAALAATVGVGYARELGRTWTLHGIEVRALLEIGLTQDQRLVRLVVQRAKQ